MRVLLPACLFFACCAEKTEYFRPTRKQLYELLKNPKNREIARGSQYGEVTWGRPPNESYQDHKYCPSLNKPKGASEVVCNGATCVVNCLPGKDSKDLTSKHHFFGVIFSCKSFEHLLKLWKVIIHRRMDQIGQTAELQEIQKGPVRKIILSFYS